MMEMEHSDWFLSGPYFAVWTSRWTAKMDRSRHICFVLLWTINLFKKLCCIIQKGFSLEKVEWKELARAEIETRKYVLGQQKKSTSSGQQTEFALPELT